LPPRHDRHRALSGYMCHLNLPRSAIFTDRSQSQHNDHRS
jgi:hypothetical protein